MITPTDEKEQSLRYRECVAIFVIELLNTFADDNEILNAWLVLPTKQDQEGVKREIDRFRTVMEKIESDCALERDELPL